MAEEDPIQLTSDEVLNIKTRCEEFLDWNALDPSRASEFRIDVANLGKDKIYFRTEKNYCDAIRLLMLSSPYRSLRIGAPIEKYDEKDENFDFTAHLVFLKRKNAELRNLLKEAGSYIRPIDVRTGEYIQDFDGFESDSSFLAFRFQLGQYADYISKQRGENTNSHLSEEEILKLIKERDALAKRYPAYKSLIDYNNLRVSIDDQRIPSPQDLLKKDVEYRKNNVVNETKKELRQYLPEEIYKKLPTGEDYENLNSFYDFAIESLEFEGNYLPDFNIESVEKGEKLDSKGRYEQFKKYSQNELNTEKIKQNNLFLEIEEYRKLNPEGSINAEQNPKFEYLNKIYQFRKILTRYLGVLPDLDDDTFRYIKTAVLGVNIKKKDEDRIDSIWDYYKLRRRNVLEVKATFEKKAKENGLDSWEEAYIKENFGDVGIDTNDIHVYIKGPALIYDFPNLREYQKQLKNMSHSQELIENSVGIALSSTRSEKDAVPIIISGSRDQYTLKHEMQHIVDGIIFNDFDMTWIHDGLTQKKDEITLTESKEQKSLDLRKTFKEKIQDVFFSKKNISQEVLEIENNTSAKNQEKLKENLRSFKNKSLNAMKTEIFAYYLEGDLNISEIKEILDVDLYNPFLDLNPNQLAYYYSFENSEIPYKLLDETKKQFEETFNNGLKVVSFLESKGLPRDQIVSYLTGFPMRFWRTFVERNFSNDKDKTVSQNWHLKL